MSGKDQGQDLHPRGSKGKFIKKFDTEEERLATNREKRRLRNIELRKRKREEKRENAELGVKGDQKEKKMADKQKKADLKKLEKKERDRVHRREYAKRKRAEKKIAAKISTDQVAAEAPLHSETTDGPRGGIEEERIHASHGEGSALKYSDERGTMSTSERGEGREAQDLIEGEQGAPRTEESGEVSTAEEHEKSGDSSTAMSTVSAQETPGGSDILSTDSAVHEPSEGVQMIVLAEIHMPSVSAENEENRETAEVITQVLADIHAPPEARENEEIIEADNVSSDMVVGVPGLIDLTPIDSGTSTIREVRIHVHKIDKITKKKLIRGSIKYVPRKKKIRKCKWCAKETFISGKVKCCRRCEVFYHEQCLKSLKGWRNCSIYNDGLCTSCRKKAL